MNLKLLLINTIFLIALSGCSYWNTLMEEADPTKTMSAADIYTEGKAFLDVSDFPNAINYFEILEARYPFGTYAIQSMLDLAYAHYAYGQRDEAIVETNRFIRLYPNHPSVDYAFYLRALSNFDKDTNIFTEIFQYDSSKYDTTKLKSSFNDFTIIVNRFPKSKYADDSINRLSYLKNKMAAHELYIAQYYSKRLAHIAAIERLKYLFSNYGGTPSSEPGLVLLVYSYNELGIYDLAYDSARVLVRNFPEYKIIQSDKSSRIEIEKKKVIKNLLKNEVVIENESSGNWYDIFKFNIF